MSSALWFTLGMLLASFVAYEISLYEQRKRTAKEAAEDAAAAALAEQMMAEMKAAGQWFDYSRTTPTSVAQADGDAS